ncbi:unnamed protein product [Caenorhabditis brenneri]
MQLLEQKSSSSRTTILPSTLPWLPKFSNPSTHVCHFLMSSLIVHMFVSLEVLSGS